MATPISHVGKPRRREGKGFLHEPPVMQGRAKERSDGAAWGRSWTALWFCGLAGLPLNLRSSLD